MHESSPETLLRAYVDQGSEAAFTELVRRCTGLVHATAVRRVGGDAHLARDVTQLVFVDLARKARTLTRGVAIAGWLHRHTCFRAATLVRGERRRRLREEKAAAMETIETAEDGSWRKLEPWLDHALESLSDQDRDAILRRFFSGEALASLGDAWSITEDAAQKRVARALERLRRHFARRGIATSSAALASTFAANGSQAAPAGLAASAAQLALVEGASAGGGGLFVAAAGFIMETKVKLTIAAALGALAAGIIVTQHRQNDRLRAELEAERRPQAAASRRAVGPAQTGPRPSPEQPPAATVRPVMIATADLEAVMARIIREQLWETDQTAFQDLLTGIENRDMPAALAYMSDHLTGMARHNVRIQMVEHWARRDPALAAAWCQQFPASAERQQFKQIVSNLWAGSDPEAALHFAPSAEAVRQLALRSPERVEGEILRLPPGDDRTVAIVVATTAKLEHDPRSVAGWIERLSGDDRANALSAIMPQLVESDPSAIASYVEKLPATDRSLQAARDFAVVWANHDPAAAANWAAALPTDSALRPRAMAGVSEIWAAGDPAQAAAWIARLPPDRSRETAAKVYVDNVTRYNPAAAAAMVPQLGAEARDAAVLKIGQAWLKSDPAAAHQWLVQMSLSEDQVKALETPK